MLLMTMYYGHLLPIATLIQHQDGTLVLDGIGDGTLGIVTGLIILLGMVDGILLIIALGTAMDGVTPTMDLITTLTTALITADPITDPTTDPEATIMEQEEATTVEIMLTDRV